MSEKIMPIGAKMYQQAGGDAKEGETNTHHVNADDKKDDATTEDKKDDATTEDKTDDNVVDADYEEK